MVEAVGIALLSSHDGILFWEEINTPCFNLVTSEVLH